MSAVIGIVAACSAESVRGGSFGFQAGQELSPSFFPSLRSVPSACVHQDDGRCSGNSSLPVAPSACPVLHRWRAGRRRVPSAVFGGPCSERYWFARCLQVDVLLFRGVEGISARSAAATAVHSEFGDCWPPAPGNSPTCCPLNWRIFSSWSDRLCRAVSSWLSRNLVVSSDCCCRTSRFSLMNRFVSSLVTFWATYGIAGRIGDVKCCDLIARVTDQFDVDIFAHAVNLLIGRCLGVRAWVKIELVNDVQEPGAAENLLGNALQPILQVVVHVGRDIIFRHGGLLHQNQGARLIARRQNPARLPRPAAQARNSGIKKMEVAPADHAQVTLKVEAFRTFLVEIVNHRNLPAQRSGELIGNRNKLAIGVRGRGQNGDACCNPDEAACSPSCRLTCWPNCLL